MFYCENTNNINMTNRVAYNHTINFKFYLWQATL